MVESLLNVDIVDGPVPFVVWGATAAMLIVLVCHRWTALRLLLAVVAVLLGAMVGVATLAVIEFSEAFGATMPVGVMWWTIGCFAGLGLAVVSLWNRTLWRKIVAIFAIFSVLISLAVGVNATFGINRTVGDVLGISTLPPATELPEPTPDPTSDEPLYRTWTPPAVMPAKGEVFQLSGAFSIPSTDRFVPRDAAIYLPPAALVEDPPELPIVVFMMGKPGDPNPQFVQEALDALAAQHRGLAPIAIVADQLGDPNVNPACADSVAFGGVASYFNRDIPTFIREYLDVPADPRYWTIGGYSNGGACAITWAAQHPGTWGNVLSISGEAFPGSEEPDTVRDEVFDGSAKAYDAAKPAAILGKNKGAFDGHFAVFTAGENDPDFVTAAETNAVLAEAAGFDTELFILPGADHTVSAVRGGLQRAFEALYPRIGLSEN